MLALGLAPSPTPSATPDPCASPPGTSALLPTLNRPTIGFSACAVKQHQSVWEIGYSNQSEATAHTVDYPQGFIRFGVARGVEVDVIGPAYQLQNTGATLESGFLDSGLGMKYEFYQDSVNVLAADLLYTMPTGAPALTAGAPVMTVNFDYGRSLSPATGFATTLGLQSSFGQSLDGRSARFSTLLPSFVVTTQSNTVTQFYAEAYGQTRLRPDGGALFGLDGGVQYLLTPSVEIDLEADRTVTDRGTAHYYGFGFGLRF